MQKLSLAGTWKLRPEFIDLPIDHAQEVLSREEGPVSFSKGNKHIYPDRKGFLRAQVPCDVIQPLVENGLIQEPLLKKNSDDCFWLKDFSWWFIREFEVSEELYGNEEVRLFIEMLDFNADILINGVPAGKHKNTFVPFYENIKSYVHVGTNQIVIRLTTGLEKMDALNSVSFFSATADAIVDQRIYMRKPQFTYGWDWCKPIPTCGIGGRVELEGVSGAKITAFRADTMKIAGNKAELDVYFEIEDLGMVRSGDALLTYSMSIGGKTVLTREKEVYIMGGFNAVHDAVTLEDAKLWWPNGYGEQNLYTVEAKITYRGITNAMENQRIGIRTLSIDHSKLPDGTRNFRFIVNGVPVFCSGGNWVPTDSVYIRTPASKYKTLVEEAKAANFTMLRMWGGGMYEPDCFYEYCSENGILLMHDFMYACAFYPDFDDSFLHEAKKEANYQTKRLAHYPCMAVWTGNNEIHESITDWFKPEQAPRYPYGTKIFNYVQPEAVKNNSPLIPYMPSSPFCGDLANACEDGDVHLWNPIGRERVKMGLGGRHSVVFKYGGSREINDRMAELVRFSSEYGFHGALMMSSVERYHDGEPVELGNEILAHHGERGGRKGIRAVGAEQYLHSTENMDAKEFFLYNGIAQGLEYQDLALALRRRSHCSGDLIWMYNDCWPETGWTIIDYFLTRKVSFYFLKRAFAFRQFIIRVFDGKCYLTIRNDNPEAVKLDYEVGYTGFDGSDAWTKPASVELAPFSFTELPPFDAAMDAKKGVYFVRAVGPDHGFAPATSSRAYYRDYDIVDGKADVLDARRDGDDVVLTIRAGNMFIPLVQVECADDRTHLDDNFFEMLPNAVKTVRVYHCKEIPAVRVLKVSKGNHDFVPEGTMWVAKNKLTLG